MSVIIKNVQVGNKITHIYIEDNLIRELGKSVEADKTINGKGKAAIPGLINTHTHAAMTLFRGLVDDLAFWEAWPRRIWPLEIKLTPDMVYWGTKLACLEMIRSGTTCFNDMYFYTPAAGKAVKDMGIRGVLSSAFIDLFDPGVREARIKEIKKELRQLKYLACRRVVPALGPHAPYTSSKEGLEWVKEYAEEKDLLIHLHLAETEKENRDVVKKYGKRPVKYLEMLDFLSERLLAAHCLWVTNHEIRVLATHHVKVSYNPVSNMKLAAGVFPYQQMQQHRALISLGTDGCASNNNLDLLEEMKFASLLQKSYLKEQTIASADEIFRLATLNGARALRLNAGRVEENKLADLALINLKRPEFTPNPNLISNLVYAATGSCIETVICDGNVVMEKGVIPGESKIIEKAKEVATQLIEGEE